MFKIRYSVILFKFGLIALYNLTISRVEEYYTPVVLNVLISMYINYGRMTIKYALHVPPP